MKAGFAEVDITPQTLGKLGRLIAEPTQVIDVHSPLYARLAVFEDAGCRVAMLTLDMNFMFRQNIGELRAAVAEAGDLELGHVMVACSHSHNSFPTTPWHAEDGGDFGNLDYLLSFLPELTRNAVAAMQPCRIVPASVHIPGLTENRRCCYRNANGKINVGTHGPRNVPDFIGTEGDVDDQVNVFLCRADSGQCLGGIVNVAAHPTTMFSKPVYSSSYIGPLVSALNQTQGGRFGFIYGVSGDLCLAGNAQGAEFTAEVGARIAAAANRVLADAAPSDDHTIVCCRQVIDMPLRRVTREQVEAARRFRAMDPAAVEQQDLCRSLYGHDFIFYGHSTRQVEVFVNEILGTWEYQRRTAQRHLTSPLEVQVLRLGPVAIVGFTGEPFTIIKQRLQADSPFPHTFFASMVNGGHDYIPPAASHANGGYETCIGIASRFTPDASDQIEAVARDLLKHAWHNRQHR